MGLEQIRLLKERSNAFVQNIDKHIKTVIDANEKRLLILNQNQLKKHTDKKSSPLINKRTGSELLSPAYAKRTGKKRPDFKLTGNLFRNMYLIIQTPDEYKISSQTAYTEHLVNNYGDDAFGVGDKKKAYSITVPALRRLYERTVLA